MELLAELGRRKLLVNVSAACYVWPTHVNVDRAVASSSFTEPPEERLMAQVEAQRGPRSYVFLLLLPFLLTAPRFIATAQRNFPPGHFLFRTYAGTQGLGNLAIGHLVQDSEGFIWAGTEDGLYRYDGSHFQRYDARQGLPSDWITSLHVAPDRTLWVGTTHGVARRSGSGFVPVPLAGDAAGLPPEWIVTGPGGRLWIATPRGPVSQRLDGSFEIVAGWPGGEASALWARSDESSVFVARAGETESPARGSVYEWDRGRLRELEGTGEFGRERIDALARDRDGNLWGRTVQRLWVLPAGAARFEPSVRELPPCTSRGYIDAGSRGDLWFPTNHGLYHQDGGVWSSVTVETGLPTSWARAAMVDREGSLWVASDGLHRLLGRGYWTAYTLKEGLTSEAVRTVFRDRAHRLWVGCDAGLLRAAPDREEVDVPAPQSLVVPWRRNSLGVDFAGMTFVHEEAVGYQVRLDSIDTDWQSISTRGARYPALPAGEYAFEVRARIGRGAWGPAASFGFEVQAAWWETWWWRGPMILAFLLATGAGIRWRQRLLRRRNEELEASVRARTAELAHLNAQLQELSLTDPLTLLHNRRYIAATMPDESARLVRIHEDIQSGRVHPQNDNIHLVFIMVDVDHFKNVNDEHGHGVGDRVLQQLAAILRRACRKSDLLVRWGGEEFLLVGRNSSRAGAALLAERIRAAVESALFDGGDGLRLHCTCSLGYASFPFAPRDPASLAWERVVDVADYCLLAAKRSGRNGWVGLAASDNLDPVDVQDINAESTPELVRAGSLHVDSSFSDTASLEWE